MRSARTEWPNAMRRCSCGASSLRKAEQTACHTPEQSGGEGRGRSAGPPCTRTHRRPSGPCRSAPRSCSRRAGGSPPGHRRSSRFLSVLIVPLPGPPSHAPRRSLAILSRKLGSFRTRERPDHNPADPTKVAATGPDDVKRVPDWETKPPLVSRIRKEPMEFAELADVRLPSTKPRICSGCRSRETTAPLTKIVVSLARVGMSTSVVTALLRVAASVWPVQHRRTGMDDRQERRVTLLLLGKELSWRTGTTVASLLSWTNRSSTPEAGGCESALSRRGKRSTRPAKDDRSGSSAAPRLRWLSCALVSTR